MERQIRVRLIPGAKRDQLGGERDGALLARVSAPPENGRANAALRRLIAERLSVAQRAVTIVSGEHSRDKLICIAGMDDSAVKRLNNLQEHSSIQSPTE